jgi:hypothetical protein
VVGRRVEKTEESPKRGVAANTELAAGEADNGVSAEETTQNGARVGDLFMSLIYTRQLYEATPFDYLTQLQRHSDQVAARPEVWMPWNYRAAMT